jgi:glycosyltransferase involved in cell wall biosynthesis
MKIAQVAPLYESVPPKLYGGTERVVSYLTEELVRQGHDVTLFAAADSTTQARLISPCDRSLRLDSTCRDQLAYHMILLDQVFQLADEFDIIHFHIDYLHYPASRHHEVRRVTTLHGRLDLPELIPLYRRFRHEPLISISNSQRKPLPLANWQGTVYHGLPGDLHTFYSQRGQYLAFLGRISPEKRVDRAIEIARRCGMPLKIAAKIDHVDRHYYEDTIRPLLDQPGIEYIGEIGEDQKSEFLGNACALLFPVDWPEPFGLVMIEALACGTPVVGWRCGSVPEVIDDGVSGLICESIDQAVDAVERACQLSRAGCRQVFESRFHVARMASDYLRIYRRLIGHTDKFQASDYGRNHRDPESILHSGDIVAR